MKVDFKKAAAYTLLLGSLVSLYLSRGSIKQVYDVMKHDYKMKYAQKMEISLQGEKNSEKRACYVEGVGTYIKKTVMGKDYFEDYSYDDVYFITEEKDLPEGFSSLSDAEKEHISIQGTMINNQLPITALRDRKRDGTVDHYMFHMSVRALNEKNMETIEEQQKYVQSILEKILSAPSSICQTDDINTISNLF